MPFDVTDPHASAPSADSSINSSDDLSLYDLLAPATLGSLQLSNRIIMAPMTRSRSTQPGDIPNAMMATYYQQRASCGLIISEGVPISAVARGYSMTPGIYTREHIEGWRLVTDAVHQAGGKIFAQLWHVGRYSHSSVSGQKPLAPSAIRANATVYGPLPKGGCGPIDTETPRAMTVDDIKQTINDFVQAAKNAIDAGFDGVEIHGAHGYLFDAFLRQSSNQREDDFGGSMDNRSRLLVETLHAVVTAIGADKTGFRLSPHMLDVDGGQDQALIDYVPTLLARLSPLGLAYVHFSENSASHGEVSHQFRQQVREAFDGSVIICGQLDKQKAQHLLDAGYCDLAAFGTPFIKNPDLVARMRHDWPLNPFVQADRTTVYGAGESGYIDYPTYQG